MAAIVGQRYGHYRYTIGGRTRSLEGSVAMLFWSWVTTSLALFVMPYLAGKPPINWMLALIYGGGGGPRVHPGRGADALGHGQPDHPGGLGSDPQPTAQLAAH